MDTETEFLDNIQFSHQKLSELLSDVTDLKKRDKIVTEYIKNCKNEMINDFPKGLFFIYKKCLKFI